MSIEVDIVSSSEAGFTAQLVHIKAAAMAAPTLRRCFVIEYISVIALISEHSCQDYFVDIAPGDFPVRHSLVQMRQPRAGFSPLVMVSV